MTLSYQSRWCRMRSSQKGIVQRVVLRKKRGGLDASVGFVLVRHGAHLQIELASEIFSNAIDLARACQEINVDSAMSEAWVRRTLAGEEDVVNDVVVGVFAAEVASLAHKVLEVHDWVLDRLVDAARRQHRTQR